MSKLFNIDDLENGAIKYVDFKSYESTWGSMKIYGLVLTEEEFNLFKSAGGIAHTNNRQVNQAVGESMLIMLKHGFRKV